MKLISIFILAASFNTFAADALDQVAKAYREIAIQDFPREEYQFELYRGQDDGESAELKVLSELKQKYEPSRIGSFEFKRLAEEYESSRVEAVKNALFDGEHLPFFCLNFKEIDPEGDDWERCHSLVQEMLAPYIKGELELSIVKVQGDWWGDYQEVVFILRSKAKAGNYIQIHFDIFHEI